MSSPQCAPVVPPKPEKDKILSPLGATSPNTRQTIGTQVNMLRQPAVSSSASSRELPQRSLTKPALPPKPSPSAFNKKGSTSLHSPQIQKVNPSSVGTYPAAASSLISSPSSNHNKNSHNQSHNQNQTNEQPHQSSINVKSNNGRVDEVAPVARIEEFDNLSDLNSPSPVRHKEVSSPPSHHTPTKDTKGHFDGNVVTTKPHKPLPPIPTSAGVPKSFPHNNNNRNLFHFSPPTTTKSSVLPISPRRVNNSSGITEKKSPGGDGISRGQIFQFPNTNNSTHSIFTPQQIQQRQGKSASLGRGNVAPGNVASITNNFKKSVTLSRVAPLDLINTTVKVPNSSVQTAPIFGLQNKKQSPVHFVGHPVSLSCDNNNSKNNNIPPPPPPRMRKSQRGLWKTASGQSDDKSPTSPTSPHSLGFDKPVYATVDKERKWAERLQKQKQEDEQIGDNAIQSKSSENSIETVIKKFNGDSEENAGESIVNSSLTIATRPSWLREKFVNSAATSETTAESQSCEGGVISTSFSQVDSVLSTEGARKGMTHQAINNNISSSDSIQSNSIIVNSTQQPHHLIYSPYNNNNTKTHPSVASSSPSMNNSRSEETEGQITNNQKKQQQPTSTTGELEKEQQENVNGSPILSQVEPERDSLCRNKSFLYAMQDTNLKELDQLDRVEEMSYEIDNIARKEIKLSSAILDADKANNVNARPHPATTTPHLECEEQINQNPFWGIISSRSISNNEKSLKSISNSNLVQQDTTTVIVDTPNHENQSMNPTQGSVVIPSRESAVDVFERELESQLESLESFCSAQSVVPISPSSVSANFNEDQVCTDTKTTTASQVKPDPSAYLEFVDSRLQSMQSLLENIATSPDGRKSFPSMNDNNNIFSSTTHEGHVDDSEIPMKIIPGMGEYMEMESGDTESSHSQNSRRLTDGDIVANILFSGKRFESSASSRRGTVPETDVNIEAAENQAYNPVDSITGDGTSVDMDLPELKANINNNHIDPNTEGISPFQRRSWNLSDYSPSSNSSSSSSRSRPTHHQRHSCDFSSGTDPDSGGLARRKQVTSSWIDIGEDELSNGALGDAESSDLIPSSTEDIEGQSHQGKVTRRKRGIVNSLFSSFGKSGASSHSSNFPAENRSQFFLDSPNLEPTESHEERWVQRDKTRSLPAGNISDVPRRLHRTLHRLSTGVVSTLLTNVDSQQIEASSNLTRVESEQSSTTTENSSTVSEAATILGDSEHSNSARSSVCYDEVLADLDTKQRKAFFVARELLTSERTFVDVLNLLTVDFPLAVKLTADTIRMTVIGSNDLDFILGGLPTLKLVNELLVKELEERILNWKENPKISDIIVKTGPFLKHYSTYVRDFERIVHRLDHCCGKYPIFAKTVRDFEASDRCQKLELKHYMLKPVQRMPQYRLLLEDYLKTLDENSEDYNDTVKAITIVKEVAENANNAINLQINAEKLMNLQNRLPNIIVMRTNRFLLKEGELLKVCRKELQPRYFALMTDVLLCMTYNASTGSSKGSGNFKDLKLRYDLPLAGMRISSKFEDYANEFSVISTTRSFNLVAKSARERDDWMKALTQAIQDNIKKRAFAPDTSDLEKRFRIGAEAPVWIQDKRVTMCQLCTAEFTVTFRRHHCRACGKCICGNCSQNQAPLQYLDNASARVCEDCYQHLLEEFDDENREKNTDAINEIRSRFKKVAMNTRQRKSIPDKFKVQAINSESRISGYLQWREKKAWKRNWFVLMDRVLYVYAASEDVIAMRTIPVLGYQIESVAEEVAGVDSQLLFRLTHSGVSHPLVFMAENCSSVEKWVSALKEATVLT